MNFLRDQKSKSMENRLNSQKGDGIQISGIAVDIFSSLFFLFFIQQITFLVESIYMLNLLNTQMDIRAIGILLLALPVLLFSGHHLKLVTEPLVFFRMHTDSISISRIQGIRVWFRLIDRYGPGNYMLRQGVKAIKAVSELSKLLYMKIAARSFTQGGNRI